MSYRHWQRLFLIPFFFMEVRVHAAAIFAGNEKHTVEREDLKLVLSPGALLHQRDADFIQVVHGSSYIWVKSGKLKFNTAYAQFYCADECAAIVERTDRRLSLKSLQGRWIIVRKGEKKQPYQLLAGMQIQVAEVTDRGVAEMEFPQSLPWMATIKQWSTLFPGTPEEFKSEVIRFREVWRSGVEMASRLHSATAHRAIASHNADLAAERARQKAREKEDQSLRELFRRKNDIDP